MADQVIDLNKTPLQNLLSLIKYDNPDLIIDQGLSTSGRHEILLSKATTGTPKSMSYPPVPGIRA